MSHNFVVLYIFSSSETKVWTWCWQLVIHELTVRGKKQPALSLSLLTYVLLMPPLFANSYEKSGKRSFPLKSVGSSRNGKIVLQL